MTNDVTRFTCASFLQSVGKRTEALLRFSSIAGEWGTVNAERDVLGFAVKFFTEEGQWDMVGNNTPVFFVRDPYKLPMFLDSQKRDLITNLRDPEKLWDFWSLFPESLHQVTILFGDRGLPASYRHAHGYGGHTYSLINQDGERVWCKFHFKTQQGIRNRDDADAEALIGSGRESWRRDLFDSIDQGEFPRWKFCLQVMTEDQAKSFRWNPFDPTKIWSHKEFPLIEVGVLELNRNPKNDSAEFEQSSFSPAAFVPGIGASADKMLQARLTNDADAQQFQVGTNDLELRVNPLQCPGHHYPRDGMMSVGLGGADGNDFSNSQPGAAADARTKGETALPVGDDSVERYRSGVDHDDYTQAGELFRLMPPDAQHRLITRIASTLCKVSREIIDRQLGHFFKAAPHYGAGVAMALQLQAAGYAASEGLTPSS